MVLVGRWSLVGCDCDAARREAGLLRGCFSDCCFVASLRALSAAAKACSCASRLERLCLTLRSFSTDSTSVDCRCASRSFFMRAALTSLSRSTLRMLLGIALDSPVALGCDGSAVGRQLPLACLPRRFRSRLFGVFCRPPCRGLHQKGARMQHTSPALRVRRGLPTQRLWLHRGPRQPSTRLNEAHDSRLRVKTRDAPPSPLRTLATRTNMRRSHLSSRSLQRLAWRPPRNVQHLWRV